MPDYFIPPPNAKFAQYTLQNGAKVHYPVDMPVDQVRAEIDKAENQVGQKQARDSNDSVYYAGRYHSAYNSYPDSTGGRLRAAADMTRVGQTVNEAAGKVTPYVPQIVRDVGSSAVRTGTDIAAGIPDIAPLVGNAARVGYSKLTGEQLNPEHNFAYLGQNIPDFLGVPRPTAAQSIVEPAMASLISEGVAAPELAASVLAPSLARRSAGALGRSYISQEVADKANQMFGEPGAAVAAILSGSKSLPRAASKIPAYMLRKNVPENQLANPEDQGVLSRTPVTSANPERNPTAEDILSAGQRRDVLPSAKSMMNPIGQKLVNPYSGVPILGAPSQEAIAGHERGVFDLRRQASENRFGGPIPEGATTPGDIGFDLVTGARSVLPGVRAAREAQMNAINEPMGNAPLTDIRPVVQGTETMLQDRPTIAPYETAIRGPSADLAGTPAIQGQNIPMMTMPVSPPGSPTPMFRPWTVVKDYATELKQRLGGGPGGAGVPGHYIASSQDIAAQVMDDAAARAGVAPPGGWIAARTNYGQQQPLVDRLERIAGTQLGGADASGAAEFKEGTGLGYGDASKELTGNLQSENRLRPLTALGPYWDQATGRYIATLGGADPSKFRSQFAADAWNKLPDETKLIITGEDPNVLPQMQDVATLGANAEIPRQQAGLTTSVAAGVALKKFLEAVGKGGALVGTAGAGAAGGYHMFPQDTLGHSIIPTLAGAATTVGVGRGVSSYLESPMFKQALAGRPIPYGTNVLTDAPITSAGATNAMYDQGQRQYVMPQPTAYVDARGNPLPTPPATTYGQNPPASSVTTSVYGQ